MFASAMRVVVIGSILSTAFELSTGKVIENTDGVYGLCRILRLKTIAPGRSRRTPVGHPAWMAAPADRVLGDKSSKRFQTAEPVVFVPDLCCLAGSNYVH
jgi:hypothetical protein